MLHVSSPAPGYQAHDLRMADRGSIGNELPSHYSAQRSSQQAQKHNHLIQSPYKVPVLPQLHSAAEEVSRSSGETTPRMSKGQEQTVSNTSVKSPRSPQSLNPTISSPIPLKQWPYVQPASATHPWEPSVLQSDNKDLYPPPPPPPPPSHEVAEVVARSSQPSSRQHSLSTDPDHRHPSFSTAESSATGDEEGSTEKKKKKPSKIRNRVKTKVKDFFTRDESNEPVTAIHRREPDPWYDEDY